MVISDPAGLLERIPELRELCEDERIRRAVEGGDPFKVYRALRWAKWLGKLRSHRDTINALLARRRLFAKPLSGTPSLFTMNGFGTSFVGSSDKDASDGTSIAVHALVFFFIIPLLPLGAYVVRSNDSGGFRGRSWSIFARVPLGTLTWLYSRTVALGVIALVAMGAFKALHDSRYQDVYVFNAFDEPLDVKLGRASAQIPPHTRTKLTVRTGHQEGRAVSTKGIEVETIAFDIHSNVDLVVWNIAGAFPVFRERVEYRKDSGSPIDKEPAEVYCGKKTFEVRDVDDLFRDPPSSISMSSSQVVVYRTFIGAPPSTSDTPPLTACRHWLLSKDRMQDTLPFMEAEARLSGWAEEPTLQVIKVAGLFQPAEGYRMAKLALAANPNSADLHRAYQWTGRTVGKEAELLEEYQQRAKAEPDSPLAQYLSARLVRPPASGPIMEKLATRFPSDIEIARSVLHSRWQNADWKGTHQAWEHLRSLDAEGAIGLMSPEVAALAATGHKKEAIALVTGVFESSDDTDTQMRAAELYARLTRSDRLQQPDKLIQRLEEKANDGGKLWSLRARAGLSLSGAPSIPDIDLMRMIGKDPAKALQHAAKLTTAKMLWLGPGPVTLAYGESVRTGAEPLEKTLGAVLRTRITETDTLRRFMLGEDVPMDTLSVEPEVRAAACVVRARAKNISSAERKQLLEQARHDDVLEGPVSEAVATWEL
ncbi:hypothetical protein KRR26_02795 [Corallococcus sp. M34]|uniref:tetratricopeptide repeat protein n=1 Tax=Citreicoccus inhibens TaxID=2849499 RepID=UPI001C2334A6|nr:hypothetical protein [Citreicoccus inhibens]MBU8894511.1 hypothetical protein [Citreicoccus inhibens]